MDQPEYFAWRGFILGLEVAKRTFNLTPTLEEHMSQYGLLGRIADGYETIRDSPAEISPDASASMNRLVRNDIAIAKLIREFIAGQYASDPPVPE